MDDWCEEKINKLLEHCGKRSDRGNNLSKDKDQAKSLYEFISENVMNQYIVNPTRKNNILDLLFCSDNNIIGDQEMMENIIHSDHTFNFVETSLEIKSEYTNV